VSACDCGVERWERDAPEDSQRYLRFVCGACGAPGYKLFREPDAMVRAFSPEGQERIAARRGDEICNARMRRALEDDGYHRASTAGLVERGGLPVT
jgi:hypothetical protein